MHSLVLIVPLLSASVVGHAQNNWNEPFPPHKVADGLYYVGPRGLASYLITTSQGHILINSGYERTVPVIRAAVEKLGFRFSDIKILLASHAHDDHVAGHALVRELTGAKVFVMRGDDEVIARGGLGQYLYDARWKPCPVDRVLKDGDTVSLGGITLTAHLTPGHTRGCTTWTMKARDGAKTHNVVIIGSPNVNPGYHLMNNKAYPEIATDFGTTFRVLKALACDVFLGAHGSYYDMETKYARLKVDHSVNPFVDPKGYSEYIREREQFYLETLRKEQAITAPR